MPEILVVEDDRKTADLVQVYPRQTGYGVHVAHDGEAALCLAQQHPPDLFILHVMLPAHDGLEVCRTLRAVEPVPIIFLTARTTEADRLLGLEPGADDYVSKPFSPRELVARVKAVLRRVNGADEEGAAIHAGDLVVDTRRREARLHGVPVHLTPREFAVLRVRARARGSAIQPPGAGGARVRLLPRRSGAHRRRPRREFATQNGGRSRPPTLRPDCSGARLQVHGGGRRMKRHAFGLRVRLLAVFGVSVAAALLLDPVSSHWSAEVNTWLAAYPQRTYLFHFLPVHASWLFSILSRKCLKRADFADAMVATQHIEGFLTTYNVHMAHPFEWKKGVRFYKRLKDKIAARRELELAA